MRRLPVIVRKRVVHRVDAIEIAVVELMLASWPLLAFRMEMHGQHAHHLVEDADTRQLQAPTMIPDAVPQFGIDQRIEDGTAVALDRLVRLGWIGEATWIALETAKDEVPQVKALAIDSERTVGAARLTLLRKPARA